MIHERTQRLVAGAATTYRTDDHGRRAAYDAEARAWGGFWYEDSHTAPSLTWEDFREVYTLAVDWAIENIVPEEYRREARRSSPELRQNARNHDFAVGHFRYGGSYISVSVKAHNGLRLSSLLHEVAHWCVIGGKPHGDAWKSAYVSLVREFCGDDDAARLEAEFFEKPTPKRKRRSYQWFASRSGSDVWHRVRLGDLSFTHSYEQGDARNGVLVYGYHATRGYVVVKAEEVRS